MWHGLDASPYFYLVSIQQGTTPHVDFLRHIHGVGHSPKSPYRGQRHERMSTVDSGLYAGYAVSCDGTYLFS
jgi:hypothetical protein